MGGGEVEKMVAVGLVWGLTNAIMRKGAQIWDRKLQSLNYQNRSQISRWMDLLLTWQYSVPFLVNLSASAAFFLILGDSPISVAVPVTNATTFAATAVTAAALGEKTRGWIAAVGTLLIVFGAWLCVS